jgi:hypothetical protein
MVIIATLIPGKKCMLYMIFYLDLAVYVGFNILFQVNLSQISMLKLGS